MLAHVFILVVVVGGKTISNDMHFWSIERCNYFAQQVTKRYGNYSYRHQIPPELKATAYCKPQLVDTTKIRPEVY